MSITEASTPKQENGYDCGMYVLGAYALQSILLTTLRLTLDPDIPPSSHLKRLGTWFKRQEVLSVVLV